MTHSFDASTTHSFVRYVLLQVTADTTALIEPIIKAEVVAVNQVLLDSIHAGRWDIYAHLSSPDLTCIEAESNHEVVKGLPFHKYYFDLAAEKRAAAAAAGKASVSHSTLAGVQVHLLSGKSAVIVGNRLIQRPDRTDQCGETRVYEYVHGQWRQLHLHRSSGGHASASLAGRST